VGVESQTPELREPRALSEPFFTPEKVREHNALVAGHQVPNRLDDLRDLSAAEVIEAFRKLDRLGELAREVQDTSELQPHAEQRREVS
jgi:hypothetical protein